MYASKNDNFIHVDAVLRFSENRIHQVKVRPFFQKRKGVEYSRAAFKIVAARLAARGAFKIVACFLHNGNSKVCLRKIIVSFDFSCLKN